MKGIEEASLPRERVETGRGGTGGSKGRRRGPTTQGTTGAIISALQHIAHCIARCACVLVELVAA